MQVVFHLGAPCTDYDLLIQSLLKNRGRLAPHGVAVPPPGRYRTVVRDTARALKGKMASEEVEEALLDAILDEIEVERMILSDPRFVCLNRLVVQGAQIWPMIDAQAQALRGLFPDAEVEFFIGMRDPATLIPALFRASRFSDFAEFSENMQPHAVTWSEMLRRLRMAHPDCPVTVWCNEDTPLIWGEIMHEMAGVGRDVRLDGVDDLAQTIMAPAGFRRMQEFFDRSPPESEVQRRRIVAAFLERFALEDKIEETLDLPGWSVALIDEITAAYEADMDVVARLPGVTFLTP